MVDTGGGVPSGRDGIWGNRDPGLLRILADPYLLSGMLLLQAYMAFRGRRKWNRKAACACAVILSGCLFLGGCGAVEPEKRMYPLALGVNTDGQASK